MKTVMKLSALFMLLFVAAEPLMAQNCNPNIPVDGGISALLIAGAGYGIKKLYDHNRK